MSDQKVYDGVIIGAGQAGGPLATELARAGWKTALIEREHLGGTCVNEGCTPSKSMVASARVAYLTSRSAEFGVHVQNSRVSLPEVVARKKQIVNQFQNGSHRHIVETDGLDLFMGEASFIGPHELRVRLNAGGELRLTSGSIFINTGARPSHLEVPGADAVKVLNSTTIMELQELPEQLLVLGGGSTGIEFGQMFKRFGCRVTLVQRRDQLLAQEDPDVASAVAGILREDGVDVRLNTTLLELKGDLTHAGRARLRGPQGEELLPFSHVLEASGRTPNTNRLNLTAAGLATDERGYLPVNERLETSVPGIYALGDVNGGPAFTHIAYDDYRIVRNNLLKGQTASTHGRLLPYTVFMDPQLGRVGLSEKAARQKGLPIEVSMMPASSIARAIETSEMRGMLKVITDPDTQQILGAAALLAEGGEMMALIQMAMLGHVPATELRETIFAHPTMAEALNNLWG